MTSTHLTRDEMPVSDDLKLVSRQDRARHLRALREHYGLSLSELARRAGISKGSLHAVETGEQDMTIDRLYAVCAALGVRPAVLIERGYRYA